MKSQKFSILLVAFFALCALLTGAVPRKPAQTHMALQPFAQQVRQVESALRYLGQPLVEQDQEAINRAIGEVDEATAIAHLEQVLDKYTLAVVDINPESRVKVQPGTAKPELVEAGARIFLAKVLNHAGVTAKLEAQSPNALPVLVQSDGSPQPPRKVAPEDVRDRWMDLELYDKNPMSPRLSGLPLEYRIVTIYSRDSGQRSAEISFNVGQGTQDLGFRSDITVVFTALPAHTLRLEVRDEHGAPTMAAFTIRDRLGRLYPNPAKRLAPDLFFQAQVYRANGDTVRVPAGSYTVTASMGPEYQPQTKQVEVTAAGTSKFLLPCSAGSIPRNTIGTPVIITCMQPAARIIKIRPKACNRMIWCAKSKARN